jgi:serine/threonine protein kinase/dipeptidyl aminopeptidase/acylaminoacyl peptidase
MPLAPGRRLGPYEITAKLGEGGMGEVYRATDTQLKREVAIKVLPAAFTADRERLARFEREAQLLAQLNHPHIAQIHGLEASGEERALVMELVAGEELAERIARGALPLDEAVPVARQIAEALEAAHEKGIVHRDLKPANIRVAPDGTVKVLDFGLAKAMDPGAGTPSAADLARSPTLMNSPTLTGAHGTQLGVILGTAAYMSPEQARGGVVDKRADVWALGVILWEMLTGRPLFAAGTVSDTLAAVLRAEIDLDSLPAETPRELRRLIRRCLERNTRSRLHDAADARIVLEEIAAGRTEELPAAVASVPSPRSAAARAAPWLAGLALGALGTALVDRTLLTAPPSEPPTLASLTYSGRESSPSVSPDGGTIAFVSMRDGRSRIWLKQLATGEEVALTAGPTDQLPVYSPDGATLLFLRGSEPPFDLYRVPAVGGEPRRLASGVAGGVAWSPDGRRIALTRSAMAATNPDVLITVSAEGDDLREIARSPDLILLSLRWSPDGRTIGAWTNLRANFAARQSIVEFDAATGERRTLYEPEGGTLIGGWDWAGSRALLVAESTTQSGRGGMRLRRVDAAGGQPATLLSLTMPTNSLDIAGAGRVVVEQVAPIQNLAERPLGAGIEPGAAVHWLSRGASVDRQPVFSPDGRHLAFTSDRGGNLDVWELELASGAVRRLTTGAADDWDPAYSPDGRQLLWSSNRGGNFEIWIADRDGSGARKVTADGVDAENPTMTPDGRWIVYISANPQQNGVWKIGSDGKGATRLVAGALTVSELSPDGRWISVVDLDQAKLRVVTVADGADVATLDLPRYVRTGMQVGRSRWLPGTSTLAWLEFELEPGTTTLVAQEIAPGRDTRAARRRLFAGTPDALPESFGISPDGSRLVVSALENRSDLLLVEGLPGIGL